MIDFGLYKPIAPTEEEIVALESKMSQTYQVLSHCAIEWYNFANIKKLRNEYKKGKLPTLKVKNPRARRFLEEMIALEEHIIACFIKLGTKMCIRHYKVGKNRSGVVFTDYVNECAMAIYDAMYTYNGSAKFSTYVTWCMKNRLVDFARKEDDVTGFSGVIRDLRTKVRILVASSNLGTDSAIQFLKASEELDADIVEQLYASFFEIQNIYQTDRGQEVDEEYELIISAVEKVELAPLELDLIDAHLRGDHKRRNQLCEEINPSTGNPYTRQRISQIFLAACDKLVNQYNLLKAA